MFYRESRLYIHLTRMLFRTLLGAVFLFDSVTSEECVSRLKWSTAGGQIKLNGQPFVLKGINYFGFETDTFAPHGLWSYDLNYYLDFIKSNKFNAIRVPFSLEMIRNNPRNPNINCNANPGLCGKSAMEVLDIFIDRAADRGLLIMLDNHRITAGGGISDLWYNNEYSEAQLINIWQSLVNRYRDKWNVFALDLKNEPHDATTWGNSNSATDWNKAAERIIRGLSSFPGLFFVEGIEWGGRMENVAQFPINTGDESLKNRVVYSPHCYGPSVYDRPEFNTPDFPHNLDSIYMAKYGFVVQRTGQPVVMGEWGGRAQSGSRDEKWNEWFVDWLRGKCLTNNFYWCLNPNSGDTGGLLEDDWRTPIPRKLALTERAQPQPTAFQARNGQICITPGAFPEQHCRSGSSSGSASGDARGKKILKSFHGTYLRAYDREWKVDLTQGPPREWEHWFMEDRNGKASTSFSLVVLKSIHSPDRFLRAYPDGNVDLVGQAQDWETWTTFKNDDGSWSLQSVHGNWLSAREDGSVKTVGNRDAWEHFLLESW